jgi:putative nucleotidyltransferase with HDIG domain
MSRGAKIFFYSMTVMGSILCMLSLIHWHCADYPRFVTLLLFGIAASQVKFRVPGFTGTVTAGLLVILICILELTPGETSIVALLSTAVQTYWKPNRRPSPVQFIFNLAVLIVAIAGTVAAYRYMKTGLPNLGAPLILALTGLCYFILNTLPVGIITSLTDGKDVLANWLKPYSWLAPFYVAGTCLVGILDHLAALYDWRVVFLILPMFYTFGWTYQVFLGRLKDSQSHAEALASLQFRSIHTLALAVEAQDQITHSHLHRVRTYATEIGKHFKLSDNDLKALQSAAILHDVGKLAVPAHILSKPGKLTAAEFEKMKLHTVVGGEIIEQMGFPFLVAPLVRGHHEKWDGSGYPDGLAGDQIPLGSRIISAVDCFDALVSERPYHRALAPEKAIEILVRDSGKAFDPDVVAVFKKRYVELETLARSTLIPSMTISGDIRVLRGSGPDAGLEVSHASNQPAEVGGERLKALVATRSAINALAGSSLRIPKASRGYYLAEPLSTLLQSLIPHDALALFVGFGGILRVQGVFGLDSAWLATLETPVGKGLAGWVADNSKALLNGDPAVESGAERRPVQSALRATLAAPLAAPSGALGGVLCLYRRQKDSFSQEELQLLEQSTLRLHEPLCEPEPVVQNVEAAGCGHRFFERLDCASIGAALQIRPLALVRIDLDGIASRPEFIGPDPTGRLIQTCCDAIRSSFVGDVSLAQIAGTEFAVVASIGPEGELDRSLRALRSGVAAAGRQFGSDGLQASIGFAQAELGASLGDLLAAAERALIEDRHSRASGDLRQLDRAVQAAATASAATASNDAYLDESMVLP